MVTNSRICLFLTVFCWYTFSAQAQTDPNNWDKLNLSSTTIAGAKVYYEKSLEPNLPFFEKKYKEFQAEKNKIELVKSKKDLILTDIHNLLGIKDVNSVTQDELLSKFLDGISS